MVQHKNIIDLFLCHNGSDKEWVRKLGEQIESETFDGTPTGRHLRVFFDEWDINVGENVPLRLSQALAESRYVAVIISAEMLAAQWPSLEWTHLVADDPTNRRGRLVPLFVSADSAATATTELPAPFGALNWIDFRIPSDFPHSFQKLIRKLRGQPPARGLRRAPIAAKTPGEGHETTVTSKRSLERVHVTPHWPQSPPKGLIAYAWGWCCFQLRSHTLQVLREHHQQTLLHSIPLAFHSSIKDSIFREWKSRPQAKAGQSAITIITGPVGAGKSTFLGELLTRQMAAADLLVRIDVRAVEQSLERGNYTAIWEEICKYMWKSRPAGSAFLGSFALSYALGNRRTVLVIEDLHAAGTASDILNHLRDYLDLHHHNWGKHLRIVVTTREPQPAVGPDVQVLQLNPLVGNEPGEFFFDLCFKDNKHITFNAEIGEALGKAFATESTRTPLFVVICTWLALTVEEFQRDIQRLLELGQSKVIRLFLEALYDRRAPKDELPSWASVLAGYEQLAISTWPEYQGIEDAVVASALAHSNGQESVATEFYERNGFLYRPAGFSYGQSKSAGVSFPHQIVADYLVSKRMIETATFSLLRDRYKPTRLEGFVGTLAELMDSTDLMEALARDELAAFVRVGFLRRDLLLQEGKTRSQLVRVAARWASPLAKRRQDAGTWEALRVLLDGLSSSWKEKFCAAIREGAEEDDTIDGFRSASEEPRTAACPEGVEALAVIGGASSRDLLDEWLASPHFRCFSDALEVSQVHEYLHQVLDDGIVTQRGWNAFRIAWESKAKALKTAGEQVLMKVLRGLTFDQARLTHYWAAFELAWRSTSPVLHKAAGHWIETKGPLSDSTIMSKIVKLDLASGVQEMPRERPALFRLAQGCKDLSISTRQKLAALTATECGIVVVSPGFYDIVAEGRNVIVTKIDVPFYVLKSPESVLGPFRTAEEVSRPLRRILRSMGCIASISELRVLYQYYGGSEATNVGSRSEGVRFPHPNESAHFAFSHSESEVRMAVVVDPSLRGIQQYKKPDDSRGTVATFREAYYFPVYKLRTETSEA